MSPERIIDLFLQASLVDSRALGRDLGEKLGINLTVLDIIAKVAYMPLGASLTKLSMQF